MKICLISTDLDTTRDLYRKHKDNVEILFELRIDHDPKLIDLVTELPRDRVVVTLRSETEGGKASPVSVKELLNSDVKYLDLELIRDEELIREFLSGKTLIKSDNIIISYHNFDLPFDQGFQFFKSKLEQMITKIPENVVCKFVGNPNQTSGMIKLIRQSFTIFPRHIFLGTNRLADILRTNGDYFHQEFVFGSTGNLNIISYEILQQANQKGFYNIGLIGKNIENSLSPLIHSIFLKHINKPGYYHLLEVNHESELEELIEHLKNINFTGFNITSPYKLDVLKLANKHSNEAILVNTINTIKIENGELIGYNMDSIGFEIAYSQILKDIENVIIIGASGAARAAVYSCLKLNKKINIVIRSPNRQKEFPSEMLKQLTIVEKLPVEFNGALVNSSPLGKSSEDQIILPEGIKLVIDLNYYNTNNPWMEMCNKKKIEYHDGKAMLFHQAAAAFKVWTGEEIDRDVCYEEFRRGFK